MLATVVAGGSCVRLASASVDLTHGIQRDGSDLKQGSKCPLAASRPCTLTNLRFPRITLVSGLYFVRLRHHANSTWSHLDNLDYLDRNPID
jgi:hypothetical protein